MNYNWDQNNHVGRFNNCKKTVEDEPEPEWYSLPASQQDYVELRGFDEDDESSLSNTAIFPENYPSSRDSARDQISQNYLRQSKRPENVLKASAPAQSQQTRYARNMNNNIKASPNYSAHQNALFSNGKS